MTRVSSFSLAGAEHVISDMGICGKHTCSVAYAQAFDADTIKTDTFAVMALSSSTVSIDDAKQLIEGYNKVIRSQDVREKRISELTAQIDAMQNELSALRSVS